MGGPSIVDVPASRWWWGREIWKKICNPARLEGDALKKGGKIQVPTIETAPRLQQPLPPLPSPSPGPVVRGDTLFKSERSEGEVI